MKWAWNFAAPLPRRRARRPLPDPRPLPGQRAQVFGYDPRRRRPTRASSSASRPATAPTSSPTATDARGRRTSSWSRAAASSSPSTRATSPGARSARRRRTGLAGARRHVRLRARDAEAAARGDAPGSTASTCPRFTVTGESGGGPVPIGKGETGGIAQIDTHPADRRAQHPGDREPAEGLRRASRSARTPTPGSSSASARCWRR